MKSSRRIEPRRFYNSRHTPKRTNIEEEPKAAPIFKRSDSTPAELTGEAKRRFDDMFRGWK